MLREVHNNNIAHAEFSFRTQALPPDMSHNVSVYFPAVYITFDEVRMSLSVESLCMTLIWGSEQAPGSAELLIKCVKTFSAKKKNMLPLLVQSS